MHMMTDDEFHRVGNIEIQVDEEIGEGGKDNKDDLPNVVHVYMLGDLVTFPGVIFPLVLDSDEEKVFFESVQSNNNYVVFFNREVIETEHWQPKIGLLARLLKFFRLPDGRTSVVMQCIRRAQWVKQVKTRPYTLARVTYPEDLFSHKERNEALRRQVKLKLEDYVKAQPHIPEELQLAAMNIDEPARLSDFIAQNFVREQSDKLKILHILNVPERLKAVLEQLVKELDLLKVGNKISDDIQKKLENTQRQFYLREQLRAIRKELGEEQDPKLLDAEELQKKLKLQQLPEAVQLRVDDELRRWQLVPVESPEHGVIRNYLEWIADLPWSKKSEDIHDLAFAEKVLTEDHYGLDEIKQRILEFLAVKKLNPNRKGGIICFIGPPGVGKTSLGRSIARALGRKFYRFSLGGMRDEAEIKGHRRTYVGAMPGRILQGMRFLGVRNPVFMLDEIDKMGRDFRGDPASSMLEVLDPEQNPTFLDHYLDLPFDLSQVLFVCTANVKSDIPLPLLDRMEIIDLSGYIPEEKIEIAMRYLLPKQIKEHGLKKTHVPLTRAQVGHIVDHYTQEAGVRQLEREMARVCRKVAFQVAKGGKSASQKFDLPALLGPEKYEKDIYQKRPPFGVAMGLAWTPVGGDVLFIETKKLKGTGKLILTGQIGAVMNESAQLALSLMRERQAEFNLPEKFFTENDFHIHFPAGAVQKDGPSAGITITVALASLFTARLIKPRLAMTGEITLRGDILPVGGIREKVVAARRAGLKTILLPERNMKDLEEIPAYIKKGVTFTAVKHVSELFALALGS